MLKVLSSIVWFISGVGFAMSTNAALSGGQAKNIVVGFCFAAVCAVGGTIMASLIDDEF